MEHLNVVTLNLHWYKNSKMTKKYNYFKIKNRIDNEILTFFNCYLKVMPFHKIQQHQQAQVISGMCYIVCKAKYFTNFKLKRV